MYSRRLQKDLEALTPRIPDIPATVVKKAALKSGWEVEEHGGSYYLKYQENEKYICLGIPKDHSLQVIWLTHINKDSVTFEPKIRYQSIVQKGACCIDAEADLLAILKITPQDFILPEVVIKGSELPDVGWITSEEVKGSIQKLSCYQSELEEMWGKIAQQLQKLVNT